MPLRGYGSLGAKSNQSSVMNSQASDGVGVLSFVATRSGAAKPADLRQVIIDTTVQEKAVTFPTDAKLMHRARERLVRLAQKHEVRLRQSYVRVGKRALIQHQRYAHAKQFKRANKALRRLRTILGRVIRDVTRKITGSAGLESAFAHPLSLARRVKD